MNDEVLDKMDLICSYDSGVKFDRIINKKCYVYIIESSDKKYYVGLSENLKNRIKQHLHFNKNDIRSGKLYILEELDYEKQMRDMEMIWITWFKLNTNCVNVDCFTYLIRKGNINMNHIKNTNYSKFIHYGIIKSIKLLERQTNTSAEDEIHFFGKRISN